MRNSWLILIFIFVFGLFCGIGSAYYYTDGAGYIHITDEIKPQGSNNLADDLHSVMSGGLNGHYVLDCDIDMSGYTWTSIGSSSAPFMGVLDGNGHSIIKGSISMFYYVNGCTITQIKFKDWVISDYVLYGANVVQTLICVDAKSITLKNCEMNNIKWVTDYALPSGVNTYRVGIMYVFSGGSSTIENIMIVNSKYTTTITGSAIQSHYTAYLIGGGKTTNTIISVVTRNIIINGIEYSGYRPAQFNGASAGVSGSSTWGSSGNTNTIYNSFFRIGNMPNVGDNDMNDDFNRFFGASGSNGLYYYSKASNCWHGEHATINNVAYPSSGSDANLLGRPVAESTYNTQAFYETILGWDFDNTWYWDDDENLPKLKVFEPYVKINSITLTSKNDFPIGEISTGNVVATSPDGSDLSYQWYYALKGDTIEWKMLNGQISASFTHKPTDEAEYMYKVIVSNDASTVDSTDFFNPLEVNVWKGLEGYFGTPNTYAIYSTDDLNIWSKHYDYYRYSNLMNKYDLDGSTMENPVPYYDGYLNGGGRTIYNLKHALIDTIGDGSTVQSGVSYLTIRDSVNMGSGASNGMIANTFAKNEDFNHRFVISYVTVNNCYVVNSNSASSSSVGGILGGVANENSLLDGNYAISHCNVYNSTIANIGIDGYSGGIFSTIYGNSNKIDINYCKVHNNSITGKYSAGIMIGA